MSLVNHIAALFVDPRGPYVGLPDVDAWDEARDARRYAGSRPVIAHPPCERWGRYATGGPSAKVRRKVGDDGGCFLVALSAVRRWGGVLEHPADTKAWKWFGIAKPCRTGGWTKADDLGGFTCRVDQGQYGHRARKATWLYVCGVEREKLPELNWRRVVGRARLDAGFHSAEERAAARARGEVRVVDRLTPRECKLTPVEFRDVLVGIARSAGSTLSQDALVAGPSYSTVQPFPRCATCGDKIKPPSVMVKLDGRTMHEECLSDPLEGLLGPLSR